MLQKRPVCGAPVCPLQRGPDPGPNPDPLSREYHGPDRGLVWSGRIAEAVIFLSSWLYVASHYLSRKRSLSGGLPYEKTFSIPHLSELR